MKTKIIIDPLCLEGLIKTPRVNLRGGEHLDGHTIARMTNDGETLWVTIPTEAFREPFDKEGFIADEVPELGKEQAIVMGVHKDGMYDLLFFDIDLLFENKSSTDEE